MFIFKLFVSNDKSMARNNATFPIEVGMHKCHRPSVLELHNLEKVAPPCLKLKSVSLH